MAYQMEEPDYKLEVRQQPVYARVAIGKEKGMCFRLPGERAIALNGRQGMLTDGAKTASP